MIWRICLSVTWGKFITIITEDTSKEFLFVKVLLRPVRKIAKVTTSVFISVRLSAWNNSAVTGRIFIKFDI